MNHAPDIAAIRARLASGGGPAFWRSLDAVAETPAFRSFLLAEFPAAARLAAGPDRRRFLKLMAASFALAGLAGCDKDDPRAHEIPFVRDPLHQAAGAPLVYASAALIDGFANGVTVRTTNGRPTKVEGNETHPWSRGGTDIFAQASVLGLYDPFRSQGVRFKNRPSSVAAFRAALAGRMDTLRHARGRGLRLLTGPTTSPSLVAQIAAIQADFPEMRWHVHAPVGREAIYQGAQAAFGRALETRWRIAEADLIVSLAGDFLDPGPHQVGASRDWADARQAAAANGRLLALHSAAATPNLTSAKADYRLVASPAELATLPDRLTAALSGQPAGNGPLGAWVAATAAALRTAGPRAIVLTGAAQPAAEHEAVHRLNAATGALGRAVFLTDPVAARADPLADLIDDMRGGRADTLLVLDANPAYTAPGHLGFIDALAHVSLVVQAGQHVDETAAHADWHLPLAHPLESWGDARAFDGTITLHQPTIAPLADARSAIEILSLLTDADPQPGRALLRDHWKLDPTAWDAALRDGFLPGTALPPVSVAVGAATAAPSAPPSDGLTVLFRPDPTIHDGSPANVAWLQELPKPLTKIVWENVVLIGPGRAERDGIASGQVVTFTVGGRTIEAPAWIVPGHADDAVTVTLGYGRTAPDLLAHGLGYDAYALRDAASPDQIEGGRLTKTERRVRLASTQDHGSMEGHDFVRVRPVGAPAEPTPELASFYARTEENGRAWGMVIDLDACTGCNACVVACQAENNIPVVGREEVALGREMHWLRIDRYHSGALDDPATHFQPVPCMHCEDAPCEVGCPVEATLHDREGLNLMVYNRCVGTRACSGYCPYKVRHFNYLDHTSAAAPSEQLQRNPDVTVRAAGVMEKCTYCVQRIAGARIAADMGDGHIPDGAVVTACQGACPTRAISFGDLNTGGSAVRAARADSRNYALLGELNLKPRTTYLAKRAPAEDG